MAGFWHWLLHGGKPASKGKGALPAVSPPAAMTPEERRLMEEHLLRQVGGRSALERKLPLDTPTRQKMARVVLQLWLRDPEK